MEMKLNIYKKGEIVKTYSASEFDLMWGTVEDLLNVIDVDKLDDAVAIGKAVISVLPQVKPLLKQIFPGITDAEIRNTKTKELVAVFIKAFTYALSEISSLDDKSGN